MHYCYLSAVYLDSGDLENARSCAQKALELAEANGEKAWEGMSLVWLGRTLVKAYKSQYGEGEKYILEGMKLLDGLKLKPWMSRSYLYLGELYADIGQRENALETLKKAEDAFQEMGMDYYLRRTQEVLERVKG